jgi:hypothetical protein
MPTERDKIEADLNLGERERAVAKCKEVLFDFKEFERNLEALEAERGLPMFYRSKPLVERLKHVGWEPKAIEQVEILLAAMTRQAGCAVPGLD